MIRAFIAASPDGEARSRLAAALESLADETLLRCVPSQNLHLTLAFLGEIGPARVDSAAAAVRSAGANLAPFALHFDGELIELDARQRILALAAKGAVDELGRVWRRVQEALAANGFPGTERRFRPHLTVARIRPRAIARERRAIWRAAESSLEELRISFWVRQIGLYRSRIGPSGARYQLLAQSKPASSGPDAASRHPRGDCRG